MAMERSPAQEKPTINQQCLPVVALFGDDAVDTMCVNALRMQGFQTKIGNSFEQIGQASVCPDVVFIDIDSCPDPIAFIKTISKNLSPDSTSSIVVMGSEFDNKKRRSLMNVGVCHFFTKPIDFQFVANTLKGLLRQTHNRVHPNSSSVISKHRFEQTDDLQTLLELTASITGQSFFNTAVQAISQRCQVPLVFIFRLDSEVQNGCKALAFWQQDHLVERSQLNLIDELGYLLKQTLIKKEDVACFRESAAEQFPQAQWLRDHAIESYIGLPLLSNSDKLLGQLAIMDWQPLVDTEYSIGLLQAFAKRVVAELQRLIMEEEIEKDKERLRIGQMYANIGTWDWNIVTGELVWTEQIAPLFGYRPGEVETSYKNFLAAVHPADRARVANAVNASVEYDVPYEIEHRVVWPDGTVRWLLEKGAVQRGCRKTYCIKQLS